MLKVWNMMDLLLFFFFFFAVQDHMSTHPAHPFPKVPTGSLSESMITQEAANTS